MPNEAPANESVPHYTTAATRDSRLRRVLHGGMSSLLQKAAALAISAVALPLTVRYLGPQRYGIWVTISSMVVMLQVMDLGIANSLTNLISRSYANDDPHSARRSYATALWSCAFIAAVLAIIAAILWPHIAWGSFFKVTDPYLASQVSLCLAIAVGFFLLSLPLNLVHRVLAGYQQTQVSNYFGMLSNILGLLAILAVIHLHGSLTMLMLMYSGALMCGTVVLNIWVSFVSRTYLRPGIASFDRAQVRDLLGHGVGFFLLAIAGMVVVNSDNLVIAHYLGAADVVPYSVTWKLAGYAAVLQTAIFPSLWPAYTEAYERGDYTWVRNTFWRAARFAMGLVIVACIALCLIGQPLIRFWAGPAAVPTEALLIAICFWTIFSTAMDLEACFLAAINRVRLQGALSIVAAALNLWLSILLVKRIGAIGAVLGTILSYTVTLVVPQTWIVYRGLYHPPNINEPAPRALGNLRDRFGSFRRSLLTTLFRIAVQLARALHILPRGARATGPQNILVVNLTPHLGDTVMLMPLLIALRRRNPAARIDVATEASSASLLRALPPESVKLDNVYALPLGSSIPLTFKQALQRARAILSIYRSTLGKQLRPTVVISPRWGDDLFRSHVLAYLTGAPRRIGYASTVSSFPAPYRDRLLTQAVEGGSGLHESTRFALLAEQAGLLTAEDLRTLTSTAIEPLQTAAASIDWPTLRTRLNLPTASLAVLAPGASMPRRVWPLESWAQAAHHLLSRGLAVVILTGPADVALANQLGKQLPRENVFVLAGQTTLMESAAIIAHATLFVGADSGPAHLAGALGRPTITLFAVPENLDPDGPSAPERIHPVGPHVTCIAPPHCIAPCTTTCIADDAHCIRLITPSAVIQAIDETLSA